MIFELVHFWTYYSSRRFLLSAQLKKVTVCSVDIAPLSSDVNQGKMYFEIIFAFNF